MFQYWRWAGEDPPPGPTIKIDNNRHYIAGGAIVWTRSCFPWRCRGAAQAAFQRAGRAGAAGELRLCADVPWSVLGSIQATNASYRQNLYGSWYYALPNGQPQDAEFLSRWAGAKRWGQMQCYGTTRGGVSIGTIDEGLRGWAGWSWRPAHGRPLCGRVAIEEDVLAEMGLEAVPGQKSTWISSSAAGARPWSSSAAIPSPA